MPISAKAQRLKLNCLGLVTSANIACGFHAGTPVSMIASIGRRMTRAWQ